MQAEVHHGAAGRRRLAELVAVECKSGATVAADQFKALAAFDPGERLGVTPQVLRRLVYGGDTSQRRSAAELVGWSDVATVEW